MAKKIKRQLGDANQVHCACLIHDTKYDFDYVHRLYNSLCRNLTPEVVFHVYTESNRPVPKPWIHHALKEWPGIRGPKASWWYKIQLFNPDFVNHRMMYFDLDTVIVGNIDWLWQQKVGYLWTIRDFKYLWKSRKETINSSVMVFNPADFAYIYRDFDEHRVLHTHRWHGDQDYITEKINKASLRYLDMTRILSWKWQIKDGGIEWKTRKPIAPGTGTIQEPHHSIYVFHGSPNPHDAKDDPVIRDNWR